MRRRLRVGALIGPSQKSGARRRGVWDGMGLVEKFSRERWREMWCGRAAQIRCRARNSKMFVVSAS